MLAPITIIGTGLAGYNLAREIRKLQPDAPIRMVTSDAGDFYSKPMLSNGLSANKTAAQLAMKSAAKMAEELKLDVLAYSQVEAIHPEHHVLVADGIEFEYSKLVLAVGADPFTPTMTGDATDAVLTVNDLAEYARFRDALDAAKSVVLLGGGLIGCEFANDLASTGRSVTIVDLAQWPLSRLLPEAAGQFLRAKLATIGVQFRAGVSATAVNRVANGFRVTLTDGSALDGDLVLSAIGLRPRISLAKAAGLNVNRGVVVNRLLETSQPDIYALGDCAEVDGLVLPFVLPIMQAVRALAQTLNGTPTALSYPAMPVVVKTPVCPAVVSPPANLAAGSWALEVGEEGIHATFSGADGALLGYALLGAATAARQSLTPQLPPVLV